MSAFPFVTRPNQIDSTHCLNNKHCDAACSRCMDVCPVDAITVEGEDVSVDLEACVGCGLCLHTCPAEVFHTSRWRERTPLTNIDEISATHVEFFCKQHPHVGSGRQDLGSIRVPTCLAAMSPGIWFELGLKKTIIVRLDTCESCPLYQVVCHIEETIKTANAWLMDCGHKTRITCQYTPDEYPATVERRVTQADHVHMSRRGFFRSLFSKPEQPTRATVGEDFDGAIPWDGAESPKQQPRLPSWMANAAHAYAENSQAGTEPLSIWPAICISANCKNCNACTKYCPTGALKSSFSAQSYTITFNPGQCVDCRICWASCPVGSITRSQGATQDPFHRRPVLQHEAHPCIYCGQPTQEGKESCYWCAEEPPMASVISDVHSWLFSSTDASNSE